MATQTTNYHLTKPEYGDPADISVINGNMDALDSELKLQSDHIDEVEEEFHTFKNYVTPEMFGAVGDGVTDDTTAIKDCVEYAYDNNYRIIFGKKKYVVSGNNPCGLKRIIPTDSRPTIERSLNIDFNLATILWTPNSVNDCFAFVGYLRNSTWENAIISVVGDNNWGNVFSTYFGISEAPHEFSHNHFASIHVSGKHNHTFDFNVGSNEIESHDDLSLFQEIIASGYNCFYYTNNSNSVALHFDECSTVNNVDNSIAFYIDGTWGGGLHISNHHFTIMDCDGAMMIKFTGGENDGAGIDVFTPRVEVRDTATNWMYCYILSGALNFHDLYSINVPNYEDTEIYGVIGSHAEVYFKNSVGVYTPFALKGVLNPGYDVQVASLIFEHCTFVNGNRPDSRQAYPFIKYMDGDGNYFTDRYAAMMSNYNFGAVIVKTITSRGGDSSAKWYDSYYDSNAKNIALDRTEKKKVITSKRSYDEQTYRLVGGVPITIPCDIVVTSLVYIAGAFNMQQTLSEVRVRFPNGEHDNISVAIDRPTTFVQFVDANKTLYLKAGTKLIIETLYHGTVYDEYTRAITKSWVEIKYHTPSNTDEIQNALSDQTITESHNYIKGTLAYKDISVTIDAVQKLVSAGETVNIYAVTFVYNDEYYYTRSLHPALQIKDVRNFSVTVDSVPSPTRTLTVRVLYATYD